MKQLQREEFNEIIKSGNDLILFFYQTGQAASELAGKSLDEVDGMLGKAFEIYVVNADDQPEICNACSVPFDQIPYFISVRQSKVLRRANGILYSNQILDLLKK